MNTWNRTTLEHDNRRYVILAGIDTENEATLENISSTEAKILDTFKFTDSPEEL